MHTYTRVLGPPGMEIEAYSPPKNSPGPHAPRFPARCSWSAQVGSKVTKGSQHHCFQISEDFRPSCPSPCRQLDGSCCPGKHSEMGRVRYRTWAVGQRVGRGWAEANCSATGDMGCQWQMDCRTSRRRCPLLLSVQWVCSGLWCASSRSRNCWSSCEQDGPSSWWPWRSWGSGCGEADNCTVRVVCMI